MSRDIQRKEQTESLNLAKLDLHGEHFEIVVDPDKAITYKKTGGDIRDVLVYPKIFSDAKKGLAASEQKLQAIFTTTNATTIAEKIIQKGSIQLTAEYRKNITEQKRKRIIDVIHINSIDPRTKAPHPHTRIQAAVEQAKIKIDEQKSAEAQVEDVLKKLRVIMPITFAIKEIAIKIPSQYAGKAYGTTKKLGKVLKESWETDGSWKCLLEIPGGLENELHEKLNQLTHGEAQVEVVVTR
jgi:ribosome maturation protein SDO1